MDYLKSEHLKFKRTISNKLIFIVPLITAIFAWLMGGYIGYQYMMLYWWYAFLLPGAIAILCSLSHRKEGICQTDARIIPILPVMLCKREYTAVAGAMILLIEISNAKNIAETSSFSTKIMPLANSNLERFTGIENTE